MDSSSGPSARLGCDDRPIGGTARAVVEGWTVDELLAVIPARGGSKRLPGKNLLPLGGLPLVAHAIAAARASGLFARIVVSTDDHEIARVAVGHGAEAPFMRAAALADDHTPVSAATVDALQRLDPQGQRYLAVCQMMPNCPLVTADDVRASHSQFVESGAEAQLSVVRYGWQNPWWALQRGVDGRLEPLFPQALTARSQDLPELFCPTGAVWWAQAPVLRRSGTFHVPGRRGWVMPWQRGLDIDDEDDLALAEALRATAHGPSTGD